MKLRRIEVAAYSVVGAGFSTVGAIIIGCATQNLLQDSPEKLARFNANFWSLTIPSLAFVGGLAAGAAHTTITSLHKSFLMSLAPTDPPTHQPVTHQPHPPQQPTHQPSLVLPVVDHPPTAHQLPTNQHPPTNQPNENEALRQDLEALYGGRSHWGG